MRIGTDRETLPISFGEVICDKICSGHNQHAIILFEGATGSGKSTAAVDLAYVCSLIMAYRLGGRPEDYFNVDHIAVLTADEVLRVTKNIKQHGIYILDDIGAEAFSARNWNKKESPNEVIGKILQTFRTKENLLIMTVPTRDFIDKIGRNTLHYKVSMEKSWFEKGLTLGKLTIVKKIYNKDNGNNIYPFLRSDGVVYNYALFELPPDRIRLPYEAKRKRIEEEMRNNSIEGFENKIIEIEKQATEKKLKDSGELQHLKISHGVIYKKYVNTGYDANDANIKACAETGLNVTVRTAQRYAKLV